MSRVKDEEDDVLLERKEQEGSKGAEIGSTTLLAILDRREREN